MGKPAFLPGDLVIAKVKGYPAWPARVTEQSSSDQYSVFFFGTFETATLKSSKLWSYTQENMKKFGPPNIFRKGYEERKGYSEGLYQIANIPDIAPTSDNIIPPVKRTPKPKVVSGPVIIKKPVKLSDGTPLKGSPSSPRKGLKRTVSDGVGYNSTPVSPLLVKKSKNGEEEGASTVSRSERAIQPKKSVDDSNEGGETGNENVDKIFEKPGKVGMKLKGSGDLVEINLDRDKPEKWKSNVQKIQSPKMPPLESELLCLLKDQFDCCVKVLESISDDEKVEAVKYIKTKLGEIEQKVVKVEKFEASSKLEEHSLTKEEYFEFEEGIEKEEAEPDINEGLNEGGCGKTGESAHERVC